MKTSAKVGEERKITEAIAPDQKKREEGWKKRERTSKENGLSFRLFVYFYLTSFRPFLPQPKIQHTNNFKR